MISRVMITKVTRWDCVCEKCGNTWTTRSEIISKACPGCKSWTWNSDYTLSNVVEDFTPAARIAEKAQRLDGVPMNDAMTQFITKAIIEESEPIEIVEDEPDEWEGWSEEQEEYDGTTSETIIFRKQLVRPFKIQEIRREH